MTAPTFTTRAEADPRRHLVLIMAQAAYERGRPSGSSRPPFAETVPQWQADAVSDMEAAIVAAERAGWRFER